MVRRGGRELGVASKLLGIDLSFAAVLAFEPVVSFARSAAFFIPAGLGVQDAGYMALLRAAGIPDAINRAAAFVLLKRFKELFWIAVGWMLLLANAPAPIERGQPPGGLDERPAASV